ncbi:TBC1D22B, partial [Symbiodinium microadriaticum]
MERILYVWAIRHPASGYVQGMNDLLTPIMMVFMHPFVADVIRCDVALLDPQVMLHVEADSFWCLTKLLDNIQDHYTSSQPGLQRMVLRLEDLMRRLDSELHNHFEELGLQYMQFAFRWMNCVLLREIPLKAIVRVWDTYLSEERKGFDNFHVYVCAVILKTYRDKLLEMREFQDVLMFLQDLPTAEWGESDVEPILSQ